MGKKTKKVKYYAYYITEEDHGIAHSWESCQQKISGKSAKYKSFATPEQAEKWLENPVYSHKPKADLAEAIYFDSGTGGGKGLQVRVTDKNGFSITHKIVPEDLINVDGNYQLEGTNNYGELMGMYIALKLALQQGDKTIVGDSRLVIDYWSKGFTKVKDKKTLHLIKKVKSLREEFESSGGKIEHISGDLNPADLGYHKI